MIVIDTSALVAILNHEPERTAFFQAIIAADRCLCQRRHLSRSRSRPIARHGVNGLYDLEDFLALIKAEIIPHDMHLAALALEAFRRYGKGIEPPRRASIFVTAPPTPSPRRCNAPLLFKGDDFAATDVQACL